MFESITRVIGAAAETAGTAIRAKTHTWRRIRAYGELMDSARGAVYDGETVNEVLVGVVDAERAHQIDPTDESLRVAYDAGVRVSGVFRPEVERVFRQHNVGERVREAFGEQAYRNGQGSLTYSRDKDHALVLQGIDSREYTDLAAEFRKFLADIGFDSGNILNVSDFVDIERSREKAQIVEAFRALTAEALRRAGPFGNVVVYYAGHGNPGSLDPGTQTISYWGWARPFSGHEGNLVFVNDSCHADTAERPLTRLGLLPRKAMVLSACGKDEEAGNGDIFSRAVIEAYSSGRPFRPRELAGGKQTPTRRGPDLDYLLLKLPVRG